MAVGNAPVPEHAERAEFQPERLEGDAGGGAGVDILLYRLVIERVQRVGVPEMPDQMAAVDFFLGWQSLVDERFFE
jgi:hypothetical protein